MIEGLKVTVEAKELRELCTKRADHHRERASIYDEQVVIMDKNEITGMQYSGGDPKRALRDKLEQHLAEAEEMDFIAAHLVTDEQYLLDASALSKLGIARRGF